jgi:chorismate synthase
MPEETPEEKQARRARRAAKNGEAAGSGVPTRDAAKKKIQNTVESAQSAVSSAGGFVTPVVDGVVDALGGVNSCLPITPFLR